MNRGDNIMSRALERAKDLYDYILDDDASGPKAEAANRLTYIAKALEDLVLACDKFDDRYVKTEIDSILKEALEENGFG